MRKDSYCTVALFVLFAALLHCVSPSQAQRAGAKGNAEQDFLSAVTRGDGEKVRALLKESPSLARITDPNGLSPVLLATYHRRKDVIDILLASGVELNIFEASAAGQTDRVRVLINQDSRVANAFAPDGFTPLGLATFFGHKEAVEALLAEGADVNVQSRNGLKAAPLQSAAVAGQMEIARLLLAHGAKTRLRGEGGCTPLHEVASSGHIEFAKLLLAHGADINARGEDGKTPLTVTLEHKQFEMAKFLRKSGAVE